jgi:peptide/nickel transport system permease protein
VLVVLSVVTFVLAELAPGDPLGELRLDPRVSPETVEVMRQRYGLDGPLHERYARWVVSVARGEWGWSFTHDQPVGRLLMPRILNTLLLTVTAMALAWCLALPLGVVSAARPRGWLDRSVAVGSSLLLAVPELLLALGAVLLAVRTGWFPSGGMRSIGAGDLDGMARAVDLLRHLALPAAVLALGALPVLVRHVRAAVAEALASRFVVAARACGIPPARLVTHHALPAAANPLVALAGLSVAGLLSTSFVVEVVFGWPGLGALLLTAIFARDLHVVVAAVLLSFALAVAGNLLAEIGLRLVDPRVRREDRS